MPGLVAREGLGRSQLVKVNASGPECLHDPSCSIRRPFPPFITVRACHGERAGAVRFAEHSAVIVLDRPTLPQGREEVGLQSQRWPGATGTYLRNPSPHQGRSGSPLSERTPVRTNHGSYDAMSSPKHPAIRGWAVKARPCHGGESAIVYLPGVNAVRPAHSTGPPELPVAIGSDRNRRIDDPRLHGVERLARYRHDHSPAGFRGRAGKAPRLR